MITYSPERKIDLHLKEKTISKSSYKDVVNNTVQYGKKCNSPRVSIVLVAYNEGNDLIRNLKCWQEQHNENFEIILVDNGLNDATVNKIKEFDLLYIESKENLGCCGGRNVGAVYANADVLIFGDADGYNPDDYIQKVLSVMRDEAIVAVRGKVLPINEENQKDFMPSHYDYGEKRIPSLIDTEGNSAWRTKDYIRVGGFEDSLAGGEGLVLQYRMVEFYGYDKESFMYDPLLILYHDYHQDENKLEYKIRQNNILRNQVNNRYPFINTLISYYAKARESIVTAEDIPLEKTQQKISAIQQELSELYVSIQKKRKTERYMHPDRVTNGESYDFSVIIPCYNLGLLLPKAIDSVFAQSLDNIEVIVVDDASTDDETLRVLVELEKHVHIKRLKKNSGVSVARNEGIKLAKAPYILCLDADDTIEITYLEKAKNIFDVDKNVGMVSCWSQTYGGYSYLIKRDDYIDLKTALIDCPVHTGTCFRKSFHSKGGGYDTKLRGYEDWDHWLRIIKQGAVVRVIPEALFNYYVRPGSKVHTSNKNSKELVARIVDNHRELYEKHVDMVVAQKHYVFAMRDTRCKELERDLKGRSIKVRKVQNQLDAVYNSTSWRLTAPLRFTAKQIKRFLKICE